MAKTLQDILNDIIEDANSAFDGEQDVPDFSTGTVLREAIANPMANQFKDLFDEVEDTRQAQSLSFVDSLDDDEVNALGANVGVSRDGGTTSSTSVRFGKAVLPTSTIAIPAGTVIATPRTAVDEPILFETDTSVELNPTSPFDAETGVFFVDVTVSSQGVGAANNVDAGTITILSDNIPGVDLTVNLTAASGGKDQQSNSELSDVIQARSQGRFGTSSGYQDLILSNFVVTDVAIIGPDDPEMERDQFGGSVDITILGSVPEQRVENFVYSSQTELLTTKHPIIELVSLEQTTGTSKTFIQDTPSLAQDFNLSEDTGVLAGSINDSSFVSLHFVTDTPDVGEVLTLTYNFNKLIEDAQTFVDEDENKILGSDVLIKDAIQIDVDITAEITVLSGFTAGDIVTPGTVINAVVTAISTLFDSLRLDDDAQKSDVITVIGNVDGVDFVKISTFKLEVDAVDNEEVVAGKQEFIRANTISVTEL